MAKRARNVGSAQASFDRILATIPARAHFEITMDADSSNEIFTDIDTNLDDGEAWLVYGGVYCFERIDPTIPLDIWQVLANHNTWTIQVHRNDDSDILLSHNDDDLMYTHSFGQTYDQTNGAVADHAEWPFRFGHRTITFSEQLRVMFRTFADWASLSDAANQIAGYLLYDRIKAPSIGQSKLGQIADL